MFDEVVHMMKLGVKKGFASGFIVLAALMLLYLIVSNNPFLKSVFLFEKKPLLSVIPRPVSIAMDSGNFLITESTSINIQGRNTAENEEITRIGKYLSDKLRPSTGFHPDVSFSGTPLAGCIFLTTSGADEKLGTEGYQLDITPDKVILKSTSPEGLFRGIQTLLQMLPPDVNKTTLNEDVTWALPCSVIKDYPTYPWRGMMLDTARHFYTTDEVKRLIDLIAQYKMNKFHLHLTDDQGWRIEIKS